MGATGHLRSYTLSSNLVSLPDQQDNLMNELQGGELAVSLSNTCSSLNPSSRQRKPEK
jgi:hypothetical protein